MVLPRAQFQRHETLSIGLNFWANGEAGVNIRVDPSGLNFGLFSDCPYLFPSQIQKSAPESTTLPILFKYQI
jgi:hypothetical protein